MGKIILDSVTDGTGCKKACPALLNAFTHLRCPLNPKISFLLPSKAGCRQIFGGGTGANCHWYNFNKALLTKLRVPLFYRCSKILRHGGTVDQILNFGRCMIERFHIIRVNSGEDAIDLILDSSLSYEAQVAIGGHGKSRWDPETNLDHLSKARVFATHQRKGTLVHLLKIEDIIHLRPLNWIFGASLLQEY